MRLQLRMQKSTPTSDRLLGSAVSAEVRTPRAHRESKRTRECRAPTFRLDRKFVGPCDHVRAALARAALLAPANRPSDRIGSTQSDKLLHTRVRVRFFVDRSRKCN